MRATSVAPPPGAKGDMSRIGLMGYASRAPCAYAVAMPAAHAAPSSAPVNARIRIDPSSTAGLEVIAHQHLRRARLVIVAPVLEGLVDRLDLEDRDQLL